CGSEERTQDTQLAIPTPIECEDLCAECGVESMNWPASLCAPTSAFATRPPPLLSPRLPATMRSSPVPSHLSRSDVRPPTQDAAFLLAFRTRRPDGRFRGLVDAGAVRLNRRRAPRDAASGGPLRRLAHGPAAARGQPCGGISRSAPDPQSRRNGAGEDSLFVG